ncbi:uncharacterized protein CLUP02_00373 [Colletotrichum lupini]|uniref:Uncharacterized protein n=1 Tax=Colletotrichum lupini TaxID=145971 RepID=A0A9Q8SC04_9PEZI|nr:uncharacterized protein CLUP02_00373 [Colletotrichum lupini]UQC73727.1 hypothetical protein CLUP02_00373 [Colletotrichum lupini]
MIEPVWRDGRCVGSLEWNVEGAHGRATWTRKLKPRPSEQQIDEPGQTMFKWPFASLGMRVLCGAEFSGIRVSDSPLFLQEHGDRTVVSRWTATVLALSVQVSFACLKGQAPQAPDFDTPNRACLHNGRHEGNLQFFACPFYNRRGQGAMEPLKTWTLEIIVQPFVRFTMVANLSGQRLWRLPRIALAASRSKIHLPMSVPVDLSGCTPRQVVARDCSNLREGWLTRVLGHNTVALCYFHDTNKGNFHQSILRLQGFQWSRQTRPLACSNHHDHCAPMLPKLRPRKLTKFWNNFYGRAISFGKSRDRETSDSMLPYPFLRSANRRGMSLKAMSTSDQPLRPCQRLPVREHRTTLHLPPLACTMREAISSMSIFIRAKSSLNPMSAHLCDSGAVRAHNAAKSTTTSKIKCPTSSSWHHGPPIGNNAAIDIPTIEVQSHDACGAGIDTDTGYFKGYSAKAWHIQRDNRTCMLFLFLPFAFCRDLHRQLQCSRASWQIAHASGNSSTAVRFANTFKVNNVDQLKKKDKIPNHEQTYTALWSIYQQGAGTVDDGRQTYFPVTSRFAQPEPSVSRRGHGSAVGTIARGMAHGPWESRARRTQYATGSRHAAAPRRWAKADRRTEHLLFGE